MIDTLIRAIGLRTGRFTSPHVESMTERISLDGEPLTEEQFLDGLQRRRAARATWPTRTPPTRCRSSRRSSAMAFATFADAPVDVGRRRGRHGRLVGRHQRRRRDGRGDPADRRRPRAYLGTRPGEIAREKAGIIKPGSTVVLPQQADDVAAVIAERAAEVGATVLWEGRDFGVAARVPAVGGQMLRLQGLRASTTRSS